MKNISQTMLLVVAMVGIVHQYEFKLKQHINDQKRDAIFEKLHTIQMRMFNHQFRNKKDNFQLIAFKEEQDKGSLAFCATIKVGHDVESAAPDTMINRLLKKTKTKTSQTQEFNVLLDTGSTNVFLLGKQCTTATCANHKKYDTTNAVDKWHSKVDSIGYISGSSTGKILADDFKIGNLVIKDQPIHVGYKVDIPVIQEAKWDGIVGLGYWYDNSLYQKEEDKSIIDIILDRDLIRKKMFSYYIPSESGGRASFGELMKDVVKDEKDILYSNVDNINDEAQWIVTIKDIKFEFNDKNKSSDNKSNDNKVEQQQQTVSTKPVANIQPSAVGDDSKDFRFFKSQLQSKHQEKQHQDKLQSHKQEQKQEQKKESNHKSEKERLIEIQKKMVRENTIQHMFRHRKQEAKQNPCKDGCRLLVDTGTYLNYIPEAWFTYFMPKSQFDFDKVLCKHKESFPDIVLTIKGADKDFDLRVSPEQYMENFNGGDGCTSTWTPDNVEKDTITLGQGFLKNFYSVYDFTPHKKRIGFYKVTK